MTRTARRLRNLSIRIAARSAVESLESRRLFTVTLLESASVATDGTAASASSDYGVISGDGHWVAFQSTADNLLGPAGDTNGFRDVFLRDLRSNTTIRISAPQGGGESDGNSSFPSISSDGRYVSFVSAASNLVSVDANGHTADVFLYDRNDGSIRLISKTPDGTQGNSDADRPSMSADGRYIVFASNADNLVANDTNEASDIFLVDTSDDSITLVSTNPGGGALGNAASYNPKISANGKVVAFVSDASNFVAAGGDTNGVADVFVYDRNGTPFIERVSVKGTNTQTGGAGAGGGAAQRVALSPDGTLVAFESDATDLITGTPADNNGKTDLFLRDRTTSTTTRISSGLSNAIANGASTSPSFGGPNGRYIAFESDASNLVTGDTNGSFDVFVYDRIGNTTRRLSLAPGNLETTGTSKFPSLSDDGNFAAFFSDANTLISPDGNGDVGDIFALVAPQAAVLGSPDGNSPLLIPSGSGTPAPGNGTHFGAVSSDNATSTRVYTIRNDGTSPLHLTGTVVSFSGASASDFSVVAQPAATLEYGELTTFTITFDPSAAGIRNAKVTVTTDDPLTPAYTFDVVGAGIDPTIANRVIIQQNGSTVISGSSVPFGNVAVGSSPKDITLVAFNASGETVTLDPLAFGGDSRFTILTNIPANTSLAPGESVSFVLRLTPTTAGATSTPSTITVNNTNGASDVKTFSFDLTGTVTIPEFKLTLNGSAVTNAQSVDFGSVLKNSSAPSKSFVIRNDGTAPLTVTAVNLPTGYTHNLTSQLPLTIQPGGTATLTVTLSSSTAPGAKAGAMTITTNDSSANPFTVNLTGTITFASLSVVSSGTTVNSGASVAFGSVALSQVVTKTFTFTNNGTATLTIGTITPPTGFTLVTSPGTTLAAGASKDLVLRLTATSTGDASGSVSISTNDTNSSVFTMALTGKVVAEPFTLLVNNAPVNAHAIPFGTVTQSNNPVTKTVTLRNDGGLTITLGAVSVPDGFKLVSGLSSNSVAPGASASFVVSFTPDVAGTQSGVLTIPTSESNRPNYTAAVTASVNAVARTGVAVDSVTLDRKIPSTVLGGQTTGAATVTLTNYGSTPATGKYKITLYTTQSVSPTAGQDKVVGTLNVTLNLKNKQKGTFVVPLKFVTPQADGKYYVAAVVTGAKADPFHAVARSGYTLQVEKVRAKIGQSGTAAAVTSSVGKTISKTVNLTNKGNAAISGTLSGDVYISKDGTLATAFKLSGVSGIKVNLAARKGFQKTSFKVVIPKKLPGKLASKGDYVILLKIKKIASSTASSLDNDGLVLAGKLKLT